MMHPLVYGWNRVGNKPSLEVGPYLTAVAEFEQTTMNFLKQAGVDIDAICDPASHLRALKQAREAGFVWCSTRR